MVAACSNLYAFVLAFSPIQGFFAMPYVKLVKPKSKNLLQTFKQQKAKPKVDQCEPALPILASYVIDLGVIKAAESLLNMSVKYFPSIVRDSVAPFLSSEIYRNLTQAHYENGTEKSSISHYDNMTSQMDRIDEMTRRILNEVEALISVEGSELRRNFALTCFCALFALFVTPPLTIYYVYHHYVLGNQVSLFIGKLKNQEMQFVSEKAKSEKLLRQMLPESVAKTLQANGYYPPENFDSATLYFSDVVGFSNLASRCTVLEIIDLLNNIYSIFDETIEHYDVYKVETIGDSYMLASGLPNRNYGKHAYEIATVSLDLLYKMSTYNPSYLHGETLLIRIGAHTGPCAAAVVGLKMPRYCIFGDTVNTASRMETTSYPGRCHISAEMKNALAPHRVFVLHARGSTIVKGKGALRTYWLITKRGFPFKVDLQATETEYNNTNYCREK